jgi:hypothetical protein
MSTDPLWGPPRLLFNEHRGSFPGIKRPGRGVNSSPPPTVEVKEWVELQFYSPYVHSWHSQRQLPPYLLQYKKLNTSTDWKHCSLHVILRKRSNGRTWGVKYGGTIRCSVCSLLWRHSDRLTVLGPNSSVPGLDVNVKQSHYRLGRGPEGSRRLRLPDLKTFGTWMW